jgi:GTP-binding protein
MADIPGIIEGASEGKGLGIRFLRHIERNSILLFIIPVYSKINNEFKLLYRELENYNKELLKKKIIIAISKCDTVSIKELDKLKINLKYDIVKISSVSGLGLDQLKDIVWKKINLK